MYQLLDDTIVHRQSTNHPELKYILEKTNSKESDLFAQAIEIVKQHAASWKEHDQALIYVPSVGMCMELARKVGWHHYVGHRETMSEAEWMREYTAWRRGQDSTVMVATSAFSTGNDYPHVHLVLHVDKPFDMLEYVQAQGRSGHDGASATCHTLVPSKTWKKSKKEDHLEQENEQAILDHLYLYGTKRCLHYGITSYTDGKGVGCLDDDLNERCSVCRENVEHRPRDIQMATMPQ